MPTYQFENEQGEPLEEFFSMGEAPHLGEWTMIRGKPYKRVPALPQLANSVGGTQTGPIVSRGAPSLRMVEGWERQAKKYGLPMPARATGYDQNGTALFRNVGEMKEYGKRDGRYVVGNPTEACQEAARAPGRVDAKREATLKAVDDELRMPEVQ